MSDGPEGYDPDEAPEPGESPDDWAPASPAVVAALLRVNIPGIMLIVVGVVNVLCAILVLFRSLQILTNFDQEYQKAADTMDRMGQAGLTPDLLRGETYGLLIGSIVALIASGLIVMAGARMRILRGYGFAMMGAILAVIPCISPCCLLGLPFGIWALIVLANPEVRAAFE